MEMWLLPCLPLSPTGVLKVGRMLQAGILGGSNDKLDCCYRTQVFLDHAHSHSLDSNTNRMQTTLASFMQNSRVTRSLNKLIVKCPSAILPSYKVIFKALETLANVFNWVTT